MNFITTLIAGIVLTILSGCLGNQNPTEKEVPAKEFQLTKASRADFDANLAKWKASQLSDYLFQVDMDCYCYPMGWMNITVEGGKVALVDSVPGEVKLFESTQTALAPTIEYLFERIEPKLDDPDYTVEVEYEARFGYPKYIEIRHNGDLIDAGLSAKVVRLWPTEWIK
jgi:hypothetical protein